jgi:hypothetical protein
VWPPVTLNAPLLPEMVPAVVGDPSPQLITAVNADAVFVKLLSVKLATVVFVGSAVPSVAEFNSIWPFRSAARTTDRVARAAAQAAKDKAWRVGCHMFGLLKNVGPATFGCRAWTENCNVHEDATSMPTLKDFNLQLFNL